MLNTVISYIPSIAGLSLIGLATFAKNTRDKLHVLFFLVCVSIASWLLALFVGDLVISSFISLWAIRVGAAIGTLVVPLLLYFSIYFPVRLRRPGRLFDIFALGPSIVFAVLCFTPFLIPAVELQTTSAQPANLNLLYTFQSVYIIAGIITCIVIMLRKIPRLAARERIQIYLVMSGLAIAVAVNIVVGFVLELTHQANNYSNLAGSLSFLVFAGATAYAVIRHRLFDMRLAITRTITFFFATGFLSLAYVVLVMGIGAPLFTNGQVTLTHNQTQFLLVLPPTLVAALTFHALWRFVAKRTRRVFYQDSYDTRETLDRFADAIIGQANISKIMGGGLAVLQSALKSTHAFFVVFDEAGQVYKERLVGRSQPQAPDKLIAQALKPKKRIQVKDDTPVGQWPDILEQEDVALVLRFGTMRRPSGLLFFGPKHDGRIYNQQDIGLLTVCAKSFGVALENAQRYAQIASFADTLQTEVERATTNLRRANQKLKTLDALKDDFISMASHQLRSPATAVRDAITMLGQDYLKPAERQHIIQLADASSERLVNVITDMLSVARIQAGHFTLEPTTVDLAQLADRAVQQASALAQEKQIVLKFTPPKSAIKLRADRAKINEIMANYIENALRYSPEHTTVAVAVALRDHQAHFTVDDQGIGVPTDERKDLFTKFFRATNARHEQPNGNGIGLFVVQTVAEAHGGGAYYEPLAHGSRFGFWLPT